MFNCSKKFETLLVNRVYKVRDAIGGVIVGQREIINFVTMGIFGVGQRDIHPETRERFLGSAHILLQGPTGTGKTLLCKALSSIIDGNHKRMSGLPDVVPGEIVGSEMLLLNGEKVIQHSPASYANILLVDEINRFSPKAQNAFVEMLAEGQITIGEQTFMLKKPFVCIATQNPSETNRGVQQLAEAISDRFVYKLLMKESTADEKVEVARRTHRFNFDSIQNVSCIEEINEAREYFFDNTHIDDAVRYYCTRVMESINHPAENGLFKQELEALDGESLFRQTTPLNDRCMLHLENAAMSHAMISGRDFVLPIDVYKISKPVLRGRMLLNPNSSAILLDLLKDRVKNETDLVDYIITESLNAIDF